VLDVAPLLGLAPPFCCYCFALLAALQDLQSCADYRSGVVHSVRALKAMCSVLSRRPSYELLVHRGPWSYEWAPPMAQLQRDLSSSILAAWCLQEPEHIPKEAAVLQAVQQVDNMPAGDTWQQLQARLQQVHAQLDAALTTELVEQLAQVLSNIAVQLRPPPPAKRKSSNSLDVAHVPIDLR